MGRAGIALLLALTACESSRSPGGGGVSTSADAGDAGVPEDASGDDASSADRSGVDQNKYVDELSSAEIRSLCEWSTAKQGVPRMVSCDDLVVTVQSLDQCVAGFEDGTSPHCTVGVLEACIRSLEGDPCRLLSTAECGTYAACAT